MQDFKKKIISGFAWEGGTKVVVQILSWASTVIVARLLVPEDYGIVAVSGIFILLMSVFSDMGLTAGLINKKELSEKEITGVFWLGILVALVLYLFIVAIAPLVEYWFKMPGLANIMMVSALMVVFSSLRFVPSARIMRDMNFKFRALVDMGGQFVMIIITISLAYLGYGPWSLILGTVTMHLVITLAYIPYMKGIGFYALHWAEIKHITSYGAKVMTSRLLAYVTNSTPTFFIGIMLGQKSTGYYSLAQQIGKIPLDKIGVIFNRVIFPATSRIKDDVEYTGKLFLKLHKVLLMIAAPMLVGFSLVSHDLVILLFTEKWTAIIPLLQLISLLNLFLVSAMLMPPVMDGMGKPGVAIRYHLLTLVLLSIATIIGLQWGLVEMLYGWFFVYPITYFYFLVQVLKVLKLKIKYFLISFKSVIVAVSIMTIVLLIEKTLLLDLDSVVRLFVMILTGFIVYSGILVLFFKNELIEIKYHFKGALS